jgi:hypothetical protein
MSDFATAISPNESTLLYIEHSCSDHRQRRTPNAILLEKLFHCSKVDFLVRRAVLAVSTDLST